MQKSQQSSITLQSVSLLDFEYFREGSDHLLFRNTNTQSSLFDHLMIFQKRIRNSTDAILSRLHEEFLLHHPVSTFINPVHHFYLNENFQFSLLKWISQKCKVKINSQHLFITENLFQLKKWNVIVQFKPKSILPDCYSMKMIETVGEKLNLSTKQLLSALVESPIEQKTRWFKKSLTQKDKNANPLQIYKVNTEKTPNYLKAKLFKHIDQALNKDKINQYVHRIVHESGCLKYILNMQALYSRSSAYLLQIETGELSPVIQEKLKNIQVPSFSFEDFEMLLAESNCIDLLNSSNSIPWQELYRFLISLTWRDISLIIRMSLSREEQLLNSDIHIIDYDLKPLSKVQENIKKDHDLLLNYLKTKI